VPNNFVCIPFFHEIDNCKQSENKFGSQQCPVHPFSTDYAAFFGDITLPPVCELAKWSNIWSPSLMVAPSREWDGRGIGGKLLPNAPSGVEIQHFLDGRSIKSLCFAG